MDGLRLEHFMRAGDDLERAQYQVLGRLQQVRQAFSRNIVYPFLADLIRLFGSLSQIVENLDQMRNAVPGKLEGLDLETAQLIRQQPTFGSDQLGALEELIRWALPLVQDAIEEGRTIFEFVDENLHLEEVGIVSSYLEEGYLIVPDRMTSQLHVLQYSLSVFVRADERYRSLRTTYVRSVPRGSVYPSPQSIKLDLVQDIPDLPNPATYFFATELDFPFEPTMLPVAKRKLMRYLSTQQGLA